MFWLCRTCGVEHSTASGVCAICADERQWVPSEGQLLGDAGPTRRRRHAVGGLEHRRRAGGDRQFSGVGNRAAGETGVLRRRKRVVGSIGLCRRRRGGRGGRPRPGHRDRRQPPAHVRRSSRMEPPTGRGPGVRQRRRCGLGDASRPGDSAVVRFVGADARDDGRPGGRAFSGQFGRLLDRRRRRPRRAADRGHHLSQPGPSHRRFPAQLSQPASAVGRGGATHGRHVGPAALRPDLRPLHAMPSTPTATKWCSVRQSATPPGSAATTTT